MPNLRDNKITASDAVDNVRPVRSTLEEVESSFTSNSTWAEFLLGNASVKMSVHGSSDRAIIPSIARAYNSHAALVASLEEIERGHGTIQHFQWLASKALKLARGEG